MIIETTAAYEVTPEEIAQAIIKSNPKTLSIILEELSRTIRENNELSRDIIEEINKNDSALCTVIYIDENTDYIDISHGTLRPPERTKTK